MIKCYFVETSNITSSRSRSDLDESKIEELSELIIKADGLIKPLILESIGDERYNVIEGHLEYYAAVRAKEKDLSKAEEVNAFIVSNNSKQSAIDQVKLLSGDCAGNIDNSTILDRSEQNNPKPSDVTPQQLQAIIDRLDKHSKILDILETHSKQELSASIDRQLKTITEQLTEQKQILALLKSVEPSPDNPEVDVLKLINTLSQEQLTERMEAVGISKSIVKLVPNIISSRNAKSGQKFNDRNSIATAKIASLGAARIEEIFKKLK